MKLVKITKDLFSVKEAPPTPDTASEEAPKEAREVNYQDHGFHQAYLLGGSIPGLRVCQQKLYFDFKERIKDDHKKQEELKSPLRKSLEELKGNIEKYENRIKTIHDKEIPHLQQKMERLKEEKSHIRKNPHEVIGDHTGKSSFYIGAVILIFLTIYLFVFYSSASFSAFFKEFTLSEIGVASSIFDPQALSAALQSGVMELILILTIPFVFLGLGYLIHKMQEEKGFKKYLKIAVLIIVTFIFDGLLAFHISHKIYNIQKEGSFANMPEYSLQLALSDINFWLIIFAGFIVYLIWGFVFDFVLEAFGKLDKVKVALREKEHQIQDADKKMAVLHEEVNKLNHQIDDCKTEIKKINEDIHRVIIPREFEQIVFSFMAGWLAWMKGNGKTTQEVETAAAVVEEFVSVSIYNYPTIKLS